MPLNARQQRFVDEYLADPDLNATAAYRRAYPSCTSDEAAAANASRLLGTAKVKAAVEEAMAERESRTEITQDKVLRHWWELATADPNELVEFRRTCCRHCYGAGNKYQRIGWEMERDRAAHKRAVDEFKPGKGKVPPGRFDEAGGVGFDPRRPPRQDCPVCFGEGEGRAFFKDTRTLSPAARRLYAGVRQTKEGLEVKVHDQAAALANVAKHLGMFKEVHEHQGKDGGPIQFCDMSDADLDRRIAELQARIGGAAGGEAGTPGRPPALPG